MIRSLMRDRGVILLAFDAWMDFIRSNWSWRRVLGLDSEVDLQPQWLTSPIPSPQAVSALDEDAMVLPWYLEWSERSTTPRASDHCQWMFSFSSSTNKLLTWEDLNKRMYSRMDRLGIASLAMSDKVSPYQQRFSAISAPEPRSPPSEVQYLEAIWSGTVVLSWMFSPSESREIRYLEVAGEIDTRMKPIHQLAQEWRWPVGRAMLDGESAAGDKLKSTVFCDALRDGFLLCR
jgi:hypothetical protein